MNAFWDRLKQQTSGGEAGKEAGVSQAVQQEAPRPRTSTEAIVQKSPDIIHEYEEVTQQVEADARATIAMLEAARKDKGNFCVTLGQGEKRVVVLVAPITGRKNGTETFTDHVAFTPQGPTRISFLEGSEGPGRTYSEDVIKGEQKQLGDFQHLLSEAAKKDGVIEAAGFTTYQNPGGNNREMSLNIPMSTTIVGGEKRDLHLHANYQDNKYAGDYRIAPVRDESVVETAVKASLEATQAPIKDRIGQVRQEINALQAARKGLS